MDLPAISNASRRSIERWFVKWVKNGIDYLPILTGRGVKTRLKGFKKEISIQLEVQSKNLKNILLYLEDQHNIKICHRSCRIF